MYINHQAFEFFFLLLLAVLLVSPIIAAIVLCVVLGIDPVVLVFFGEIIALCIVLTITITVFVQWMFEGINTPVAIKQTGRT